MLKFLRKKLKVHADWIFMGLLILICLIAYDPGRYENTSGDTISNRYWPIAILKFHSFDLNFAREELAGVAHTAIYKSDGTWLPKTDLGMAVFTLPFYAFVDAVNLGGRDWTHDRFSYVSRWNAILIAIAAVLALYLLLKKVVSPSTAFFSSLLFAIGTWHWSVGAQGLTTQTPAVLCQILIFHLVWKLCEKKNVPAKKLGFVLGLLLGLTWATRPSEMFLIPALIPLLYRKRVIPQALIGGALVVVPVIQIYMEYFGHPLGYRGILADLTNGSTMAFLWNFGFPIGSTGLLFSPNRGAIVFFPLLLLVPFLWRRLMPSLDLKGTLNSLRRFRVPDWSVRISRSTRKTPPNDMPLELTRVLGYGALFYFVSISSLNFWHSTWSYGPRYLYELLPLIWPVLTLGFEEMRKGKKGKLPLWASALIVIFSLQGIFVHALGHRNFDLYIWNRSYTSQYVGAAWNYQDFMLGKVWDAGSNRERWPSALYRLKTLGY